MNYLNESFFEKSKKTIKEVSIDDINMSIFLKNQSLYWFIVKVRINLLRIFIKRDNILKEFWTKGIN